MSLLTFALGFWHYALAALLIAGALAALVYLPGKLGGIIAMIAGGIAAAVFSYQLGFQERGKLDQSEQLKAEIAERQREAQAAKDVAARAVTRANEAEAKSNTLQEQVDDYAAKLSKRDACLLDRRDVDGLQSIGGSGHAKPPAAPGAVR